MSLILYTGPSIRGRHCSKFLRNREIVKTDKPIGGLSVLARPARFERATFRLGGERSILLSYGRITDCLTLYSIFWMLSRGGLKTILY